MMATTHRSTVRPGQGAVQEPSRVGAAELRPQDHRVAGPDHLLDLQVEIRKLLVVPADGFGSGRRSGPERVDVVLAAEVGGRFEVAAVPGLVNESPYLRLALDGCRRHPVQTSFPLASSSSTTA
jgi:hypothetical protein